MFLRRLLQKADPGMLNALSLAGTIGLHLVSGIAVGSLMGYLLDRWLETAPWGLGIGMIAGIIAGFKNVFTDAKRLIASQEQPFGPDMPQKTPNGSPENSAKGAASGADAEQTDRKTDKPDD